MYTYYFQQLILVHKMCRMLVFSKQPPSLVGTNPPLMYSDICVEWGGVWEEVLDGFHKKSPEDAPVPAKVMTLHSVCEHLLMEVLSRRYICFYWLNCHYHKNFTVHSPLVGIYQIL